MKTVAVCEKCGSPVAESDAGGVCPRCLLGLGMHQGDPTLSHPSHAAFPVPRVEELVGKFPNLEIQHFIGQGGMGAVYQARQIGLDRQVALKILSPRLGSDPSFTERFTREARTLAKLTHPNIVMVFEYGQADDMNYLVMEFVDGINLRDAISEGKLSPEEALSIVPQICDALQYAHDEGVIHRDIKPENILIDKRGRVKIADFGLAKLLEPSREEFTLTGTQQVLGTRNYMAPEQIEKPDVVDHRADLYSLGVVFYELLTGELPIGRFAMPSEKAHISNQLDDVVLRTLEKEPARRFQQASEIKTAVDSIARSYAEAHPVEPQPFADPQPQMAGANKSICSLPFSIGDLYGGLAVAYGIAHVHDDAIELEYEVQDDVFGSVKSGAKQAHIPIQNILSISFVKGIFSDRIEVQTDRLDVAKDVPNNKQARFRLATKRADIDRATRFVGQVESVRHGLPADRPTPVPPRKQVSSPSFSLPVEDVDKALNVPRIGLLVAAWINLAIAIITFARTAAWKPLHDIVQSDEAANKIWFLVPKFSFSGLIALLIAIWLFALSSKLKHKKDAGFVFISCIVLLFAPTHPAYVVTMIFSVWTIVLLCDSRIRDSFDTNHRFLFKVDRGMGPQTRRGLESLLRAVLLFGILAFFLTITAGILYLAVSYKEAKSVETKSGVSVTATDVIEQESESTPKLTPEQPPGPPSPKDAPIGPAEMESSTQSNSNAKSSDSDAGANVAEANQKY